MDNCLVIRPEIYDDMGWPLPDWVDEGYDISGFPVCRVVGAIIDNELILVL